MLKLFTALVLIGATQAHAYSLKDQFEGKITVDAGYTEKVQAYYADKLIELTTKILTLNFPSDGQFEAILVPVNDNQRDLRVDGFYAKTIENVVCKFQLTSHAQKTDVIATVTCLNDIQEIRDQGGKLKSSPKKP